MRGYQLADEQWALLAILMPGPSRRGGAWRDHRQVVNGLLWSLNTGAQWRDIPERYGPWRTIHDRFVRWRRDGTLDRILDRLRPRLDEEDHIDPDTWCVDARRSARRPSAAKDPMRRRTTELSRVRDPTS